MPKSVSSSEAKAHLGELVKWTTETQDKVIVKVYGEPTAVIMSYSEYMEMEKLRKRELKRRALEALDALRDEVRRQQPTLSVEEAYRMAGFSEEVIRETLDFDAELASRRAAQINETAKEP